MAADMQSPASDRLKLRAEDAEDLAVIAACLQDAVALQRDMAYLPRQRRFAIVLSRFRWEDEVAKGAVPRPGGRRIRTGLHFEGVLRAEVANLDFAETERPLELLTITCEPDESGGAELVLLFCGGSAVRLRVECIECYLADMGEPWDTSLKPNHPVPPGEA